jgi:hypothetical protein
VIPELSHISLKAASARALDMGVARMGASSMATMKRSMTKMTENSAVRRSIRTEIGSYADDVFLTEPEAAEACGVSPHTLKCWRLAREGKGPPAVKVYDMARYRAADVRA